MSYYRTEHGIHPGGPTGKAFVICCPFHQERTPGCMVRSDQTFHCFGCWREGRFEIFEPWVIPENIGSLESRRSKYAAAVAPMVESLQKAGHISAGAAEAFFIALGVEENRRNEDPWQRFRA